MKLALRATLLCLLMLPATWASAEFKNFYIGLDSAEKLSFGTYTGLDNPNKGRLTFLYAHTFPETPADNHYHGIGAYSYTGDVASPTVIPTNANNRIPETYTAQPPLTLSAGSGAWAGKLVSQESAEHYSDLHVGSVWELSTAAAGTPEAILFNSSAGGYSSSLDGSEIWLELVSKSSGLHVGAGAVTDILSNPGDTHALGAATRSISCPSSGPTRRQRPARTQRNSGCTTLARPAAARRLPPPARSTSTSPLCQSRVPCCWPR